MCKSQDHQQLLYYIKNIISPNFEFIKLDYNYIGFKNGIYDLSNATFILTADIFDNETIEFIYFIIGRLMTKLNDEFDSCNKLPNYKDGKVVRRFMVANFEKIIPEESRNTNLENEIKDQKFGVFLHCCRSTYLKFYSKYKNKGVETFCPVSFIENLNFLRMATNSTYQFISENCKYQEGASISVPQLNKAMRAYIKENMK
ncbi:unnamed protein product [Phytophthora lilii]|uniref:Unnamed protein product n=1 Tax=Phytophthora lilii TaxID=2077276 RepID=A0A9W6WWP4_9STRA|nr:unnamed protein product [Phytophthora lilii]